MIVLGLNHGEIGSSAALVIDGNLIVGAPEERFVRRKYTKEFPKNAIEFCLKKANLTLTDVDYVAQAWNPGASWHKFNPLISNSRVKREDYFYSVADNLYKLTDRTPKEWTLMSFPSDSPIPPIYFVQHHRAHAANSFYSSQFEEAAILTCDWKGEYESTTMGIGRGLDIEIICSQCAPNSLGLFYATYTELLGFRSDKDEWKVMALGGNSEDVLDLVDKIRTTLKISDIGTLELDQSFYKGALLDQPELYTSKLVNLVGSHKNPKDHSREIWQHRVAKAMQIVAEEIALSFLRFLHDESGCSNLVLGGGFFMNCVFNGKVIEKTEFEHLFVPYAPSDCGNSIGAALYVSHTLKKISRNYSIQTSQIGPDFSDDEIKRTLIRRKLGYVVLDEPERHIATLIANGHIVAHFHGRMEFGERALGNRSIFADPGIEDINIRLNQAIKYRESFRPFAPVVNQEYVSEYFEVSDEYECNYMEKVVMVRKMYRDLFPGFTHADGSARVQTVNKQMCKRLHKIVGLFSELRGYHVLLNTSFNVNEEPIVLSPDDALNTFFNSGLQHVVIGRFLVTK